MTMNKKAGWIDSGLKAHKCIGGETENADSGVMGIGFGEGCTQDGYDGL
jgi:hypothetical protein